MLRGKLRGAMVTPSRALLSGVAEIDDTQVSCRNKDDAVAGGGGSLPEGKRQAAPAVEIVDKVGGRFRLGVIDDGWSASLQRLIKVNVTPRAVRKTDGRSGDLGVPDFTREPHVVSTLAAHIVLPSVLTPPSPTSRPRRSVSTTASANSISRPTGATSHSASTDADPHPVFKNFVAIAVFPVNNNMSIAAKARR